MSKLVRSVILLGLVSLVPAKAWAIPVVDGYWTSANTDGYTMFLESYKDLGNGGATDQGVLGLAIDGSFLYVMFAQQTSVNDNAYGIDAVNHGWGSKHDEFKDLQNSDAAAFVITNSMGSTVFSNTIDYISCAGMGNGPWTLPCASLGTGGDGVAGTGSAALTSYATSAQWNIANNPCALTSGEVVNSPTATTAQYNANEVSVAGCKLAGTDWLFPTIWEFKLSLASLNLGTTNLATIRTLVNVTDVHNSPSKGVDTIACDDPHFSPLCSGLEINPLGQVPEPGTLVLFGSGALALAVGLRRRKIA